MKLFDREFLILDCQTTGATPASGNLLEIAWCVASARDGYRSEIKSFLVKQPDDETIPRHIEMLTGITNDHMAESVASEEVYKALSKAIRGKRLLTRGIAHYARFETPFLLHLAEQHGPSDGLPIPLLCTCEIAKRLFPNVPSRGIRALAGYLGAPISELKRSSCHVSATFLIWKEIEKKLRDMGLTTLEEVEEWLRTSKVPKRQKYEFALDKVKRLEMPNCPGVYRMLDCKEKVLYVGKATSLRSRVNSYFRGKKGRDRKMEMLAQVANIAYTECRTPLEAALLETDEIKRLDPPYNYHLKIGGRRVAFFNRDFTSMSHQRDETHRVGPFNNELALSPVLLLARGVASSAQSELKLSPAIFYQHIEEELIVPGFRIFCERFNFDPSRLNNVRSLLALGLKFYREAVREQKALALLEQQALEAQALEDGTIVAVATVEGVALPEHADQLTDGDEDPEEDLEEEMTAEDVADKFKSMLVRNACTYLHTHALTSLMNSTISFTDGSVERTLKVRGGVIEFDGEELKNAAQLFAVHHAKNLHALNIGTYDRMRVLLTELVRVRAEGGNVRIVPKLSSYVMNCEA